MSTHNIGFYEDLTKIIFELSSNIIKYAPYFFCCSNPAKNSYITHVITHQALILLLNIGCIGCPVITSLRDITTMSVFFKMAGRIF